MQFTINTQIKKNLQSFPFVFNNIQSIFLGAKLHLNYFRSCRSLNFGVVKYFYYFRSCGMASHYGVSVCVCVYMCVWVYVGACVCGRGFNQLGGRGGG